MRRRRGWAMARKALSVARGRDMNELLGAAGACGESRRCCGHVVRRHCQRPAYPQCRFFAKTRFIKRYFAKIRNKTSVPERWNGEFAWRTSARPLVHSSTRPLVRLFVRQLGRSPTPTPRHPATVLYRHCANRSVRLAVRLIGCRSAIQMARPPLRHSRITLSSHTTISQRQHCMNHHATRPRTASETSVGKRKDAASGARGVECVAL